MIDIDITPWHRDDFSQLWTRRDRLPHAILLHGKQGTGKLRFAVALARAALCEKPLEEGACGDCASCVWFAGGSHPDFRLLQPETREEGEEEGGKGKTSAFIIVEQVRGLSDFLSLSTHRGGWRPIVVYPAEALNASAANALLKSLEEPPPRTLFILISHRLHRVLPTIKSRCQLLPLRAPGAKEAADWLKARDVEHAELAAAHSGGAPLLAADLPLENYWALRLRFVRHLAGGRIDPLAAAEECQEAGIPVVLEWLQKWTYDVAIRKFTGELRYNVDQEQAIDRISTACDPVRMLRFHRELLGMQRHAQHPLNARLFFEQLMMSYAEAAAAQLRAA